MTETQAPRACTYCEQLYVRPCDGKDSRCCNFRWRTQMNRGERPHMNWGPEPDWDLGPGTGPKRQPKKEAEPKPKPKVEEPTAAPEPAPADDLFEVQEIGPRKKRGKK